MPVNIRARAGKTRVSSGQDREGPGEDGSREAGSR